MRVTSGGLWKVEEAPQQIRCLTIQKLKDAVGQEVGLFWVCSSETSQTGCQGNLLWLDLICYWLIDLDKSGLEASVEASGRGSHPQPQRVHAW